MNRNNTVIYSVLVCLTLSGIPSYFISTNRGDTHSVKNKTEIPLLVLIAKPANGTFQDNRDGKIYREIKIGNQIWMAENLNYGKLVLDLEQQDNNQIEKTFYHNDTILGEKLGALYTWKEAMNYKLPGHNEIIQGICPDGWHLPSDVEWNILCSVIDQTVKFNSEGWLGKNIAIVLLDSSKANFNAKMAGNAVSNWFFYLNKMAYYWTSTKYSSASAYYRCLSKDSKQIYKGAGDVKIGMSVRCIKD